MEISGWGNFPKIEAEMVSDAYFSNIQEIVSKSSQIIPNGLLRSYGDSALGKFCFSSAKLNRFLLFDKESGLLTVESGVSLLEINKIFIPQGWFLPVTPGTQFVTIGGAIASDVHGKNHHKVGTFGNFVKSIKLLLPNSQIVDCNTNEDSEIFKATIGGIGLTGIILQAQIMLIPITSPLIEQTTLKSENLDELFENFSKYNNTTYSVAWIDTFSNNSQLGKGLLFLGEHFNAKDKENKSIEIKKTSKITIPFNFPSKTLNPFFLRIFNYLYYSKEFKKEKKSLVYFDKFFYPLDAINHWNRIYGKNGFAQYQFVVPIDNSKKAIVKIYQIMRDFGQGSFLTVLKQFGDENGFYLSFPNNGFTLAMDFAINRKTLEMFDAFDKIILEYGGRLYLTKDSRMSNKFFHKTYEDKIDKFKEIKSKVDSNNKFNSLQSKRLAL